MKRLTILNKNLINKRKAFVLGFIVIISIFSMITSSFASSYCVPKGTGNSCKYGSITHVTFNTIDNNSDCSEYSDFSDKVYTTVKLGTDYDLGVTLNQDDMFFNVWIDFNHNGTFDKDELVIDRMSGTKDDKVEQTISIPKEAVLGFTAMRIMCDSTEEGVSYDPCVITYNGEVEDYGIFISGDAYCTPKIVGTPCKYGWIQNVSFNSINNNSGCDQYSDYSNTLQAFVKLTENYDIGLTTNKYDVNFNVWIDLNQDGEFGKDELIVDGLKGIVDQSAIQNISIKDAKLGNTVMRIMCDSGSVSSDPCTTAHYGEVEDYAVNIRSGYDAGIISISNPVSKFPVGVHPIKVIVKNYGENTINSMTLYWNINGKDQKAYEWSGELKQGEKQEITIGEYDFSYSKEGPFDPFKISITPRNLNNQKYDDNVNNDIMEEVLTPLLNDAAILGLFTPKEGFGFNNTQLTARVLNNLPKTLTSVTVKWKIDGVEQTPVTFSDLKINFGEYQDFALGSYNFIPKANMIPYTFEVSTDSPNGVKDENTSNDIMTGIFIPSLSENTYTIGGKEANFADFNVINDYIKAYGLFGTGYLKFQVRPNTYSGSKLFENSPKNGFSIVFESSTGISSDVIINANPTESDNYVFKVNGYNDVIFRNITFENLNSAENKAGLVMDIENANHCSFENVIITGIKNSPNDPVFNLVKAIDVSSFDITNSNFNNGSVSFDAQSDNKISTDIDNCIFSEFGYAGIQVHSISDMPVNHIVGITNNSFVATEDNKPESGVWVKGYAKIDNNIFSGIIGIDSDENSIIKVESPMPDKNEKCIVSNNTIADCKDVNAFVLENTFAVVNNNNISDLPLSSEKILGYIIKINGYAEINNNTISGITGSGLDGQSIIKVNSPDFENTAILNNNSISKCEKIGGIILENTNVTLNNNSITEFKIGNLIKSGYIVQIIGNGDINNNTVTKIEGSGNDIISINGFAHFSKNVFNEILGTKEDNQSVIRVISPFLNLTDDMKFTDNQITNCENLSCVIFDNSNVTVQNNNINNIKLGNANQSGYALLVNGFAEILGNNFNDIIENELEGQAIIKVESPYINQSKHTVVNNNRIINCTNINGLLLANNYNDVDNNIISNLHLVSGSLPSYALWVSGYGNISNNKFSSIISAEDKEQTVIKVESESIDHGNSNTILKNSITDCKFVSGIVLNNAFVNISQNNISNLQFGENKYPNYGILVKGYAEIIQNNLSNVTSSSLTDNSLIQVESPKIDNSFNTVLANNEIKTCYGLDGIKLNNTFAIYTNNNISDFKFNLTKENNEGSLLSIYGYPLVIAGNNFDKILGTENENQTIIKLESPAVDVNNNTVIANNNFTNCKNVNGFKLTNLYNLIKQNYMVLNQQNTTPNSIMSINGCSGFIGNNMIIGTNLKGILLENTSDLSIIYNSIELNGSYSIINSINSNFSLMRNMLSNEGTGYVYDINGGSPILKENTMMASSGKVAIVNGKIYNKTIDLVKAGIDNNSRETKILCQSETDMHIFDATPEMFYGYPLFADDKGNAGIIEKNDWDGEARTQFYTAGIDEVSLFVKLEGQSKGFIDCENSSKNSLTVSSAINYYSDIYYQWDKDGVEIDGATSPVLYFPNLKFSQSGLYRCKIMGPGATKPIYSNYVAVYVATPTAITVQPDNSFTQMGSKATFTFTAHVNGKKVEDAIINDEVKVQWYKWISATQATPLNDVMSRISGSKSNYLTINNVVKSDLGKYFAEVTGLCSTIKTIPAELFEESLEITVVQQPTGLTNCEGTDVDFYVDATTLSSKAMSYQWYKGSSPLTDLVSKVNGSKTKHLSIFGIDKLDNAEYYAVISLEGSQQVKQSDKATLVVELKPEIATQPQDVSIKTDAELKLEVILAEISDPSLKYQWYKDNKAITNATSSIYTKAKADAGDEGEYWCVVNNNCGNIKTDKVRVVVTTGSTGVTAVESNGYSLSIPYPNPVSNVSNVSYYIPQLSNVKITLSDIQGSFRTELLNQMMDSGEHNITINANQINITNGTYFLRLESNGVMLVQKIIVIK